jgi:hypothetical protein
MKTHGLEDLKSMFSEMGLGTEADRDRYLGLSRRESSGRDTELFFFRLTNKTEEEGEGKGDAELA